MKSCPTCNRTFEDTFTFCLVDGSILSAPFDPKATEQVSQPRDTTPPPTLVIPPQNAPNSRDVLPPTVVVPQSGYEQQQQQPPVYNAPSYQQPQQFYQQPQQFFPGQSASVKIPGYSYVLAVVAGMIALFLIEMLAAGLGIYPFFNLQWPITPPSLLLFLISYGALGFLFGYRWPQGRWTWGLWLAVLPVIALIGFGFQYSYYFGLSILSLLLLPATCLGALWATKIAQRKRAG